MRYLVAFPILIVLVLFLVDTNQATLPVVKEPFVQMPVDAVVMKENAVAMGIEFNHARRSYRQNSIADMYGNGACVLDFDQDGFEDIIMVAGQGATRRYGRNHWWNNEQNSLLYRNIKGKYFDSIPLVQNVAIAGFGCTVGDLNHDGLDDVVIGDIGKLHLLVNNGKDFSHYTRMLNDKDWPTSLLITDINQDKLNDIVVATLVEYRNDLKVGDQEYGYQGAPTVKTQDYAGQNNLILKALSKDALVYEKIELVGQQRTLNWLKLNEQQLLAVNAKGSNSVVQGLSHKVTDHHWLTFAATQISPITVAGKAHLLIANHSQRGIQLLDPQSRLNRAWSIGLTNQFLDASQSWANIVSDFNNDGFEDVFVATGFASIATNSPSRSQASSNFLLLQDNIGQFHNNSHQIQPQLARSSRTAVQGDFNNDGFIDVVVMNNNNFASLYLNQGNDNHWLSIDCTPRQLCLDSQWVLQINNSATPLVQAYHKATPYLSHGSSRIHFGLAKERKIQSLRVNFANGKTIKFGKINSDNVYQVNLTTQTINPINNANNPAIKPSFDNLFSKILLTDNPAKHLSQLKPYQSSELLDALHSYKQGVGKDVITNNENITATIGWLLSHIEKPSTKLIDLLIASENRLFVDYMVALLPQLNTVDFCYLSEHLHYWFEQEEVLPETKLTLIAPILREGLTRKQTDYPQRLICAIEAASYAEQTTIGASILPLLKSGQPMITASSVRAIGRLKYAQGKDRLKAFCEGLKPQHLLLKAECQISLQKLNGQLLVKKNPLNFDEKPTAIQKFLALHSESLLFNFDGNDGNDRDLAQISVYQDSPIRDHRFLAYQALLLQGHYQKLLTKADVVDFVIKAKSHYPQQIDKFMGFAIANFDANQHSLWTPLVKAIAVISNEGIKPLFEGEIDAPLAMELVKLCLIRQSLKPLCQRHFETDVRLKTLSSTSKSANSLTELPKEQLYNLTAFGTKIQKRIIARQLAEAKHFGLLHWQGLYHHIGQVESNWGKAWLEDFVHYSFKAQHNVDLSWLEKVAQKQAVGPWTQVYLAHIKSPATQEVKLKTAWRTK